MMWLLVGAGLLLLGSAFCLGAAVGAKGATNIYIERLARALEKDPALAEPLLRALGGER